MRKNKIRSTRQLIKKRKKKAPNVYDYQKEFGSWKKALHFVWGKEVTTDFTPIYMLQCICFCHSYTAKAYRRVRRKNIHSVPSLHSITIEYGSWRKARIAAMALAFEPVEEARNKLQEKLGHPPTVKECKKHGINVQVLVNLHGGGDAFENMTRRMEKISAK